MTVLAFDTSRRYRAAITATAPDTDRCISGTDCLTRSNFLIDPKRDTHYLVETGGELRRECHLCHERRVRSGRHIGDLSISNPTYF